MTLSRIELNQNQIEKINWQNLRRAETGLANLLELEPEIEPEPLQALLQAEQLQQEPRYDAQGILYPDDFYEALRQRMHIEDIIESQPLRCAVSIDNALLRLYPTMAASYRHADVDELDRYAVSVLKLGEPVLLYWQDTSATWSFVRTVQGFGWVEQEYLAMEPDAYRWQQYCNDREKLVVADNRRQLDYVDFHGHAQTKTLLMGTRLPLYDATRNTLLVGLPIKDRSGNLAVLQLLMQRDGGLVPGNLPLSAQNILSQAKKMLGEPYGWGGTSFYRDCTMLITDVFSVFGLQFPRNSRQQMQMFGLERCPQSREQKQVFLQQLMPGSVLYFPGHAMLYLGEQAGKLQILHAVYALGLPEKEHIIPHKLRRVVQGNLMQQRVNGEYLLDAVRAVWVPNHQKQFLP